MVFADEEAAISQPFGDVQPVAWDGAEVIDLGGDICCDSGCDACCEISCGCETRVDATSASAVATDAANPHVDATGWEH